MEHHRVFHKMFNRQTAFRTLVKVDQRFMELNFLEECLDVKNDGAFSEALFDGNIWGKSKKQPWQTMLGVVQGQRRDNSYGYFDGMTLYFNVTLGN